MQFLFIIILLKEIKLKIRYFCSKCRSPYNNTIESFSKWFWTPHLGARKLLKCKCCGKRNFMYRVDGRKWIDWPKEKK